MREEIYTYDAFGNRTAYITPPEQPAHTFDYTEVDLTDSYTPPAVPDSAGGINYLYDKDKKLLQTVFSDSSSIQMVYDTTFSGSSRPIAINYDQGSTAFAYDSTSGNLTSVVSSDSVEINYSYDGSLTTQLSAQGPVSGTIHYTYDNDFRVTSQILNGADTLAFSYSDDGLITKAGELSLSYDSQNRLLTADTLGQVTGSYGYNGFGELTGTTYRHNASDLYDRSFTHDSVGRLTSLTEVIEGDTTQYEYAYNDIGYLIEVKEDGAVTAEYQYDSNGNRTAYITPTDTVTATYDEQDRMLTYGNASYTYGKRGELQQKIVGTDTTTYDYDNLGNLRSVVLPDGTLIEYIIDGQGRRVGKKVEGQLSKRWLYAGGLMPVADLDSAGNVSKRYGPGYIVKNDTTYRVIKDHLGSVRMIVNSQTGQVIQRIDYDAWGQITHLQNQQEFTDIGFAGGLYDRHTGLVRFGARDYDPQTGRWTTKDPILFAGGTSNLYQYVSNDPVNNIDPVGLLEINAWTVYNWIGRDNLNAVRDFAAGVASGASAGLSNYVLDALGDAGRRDRCSEFHTAGEWIGASLDLALGGKSLLKNLSETGVGPLEAWIRPFHKSYSRKGGFDTRAFVWGSTYKHRKKKIASEYFRNLNKQLREWKLPWDSWRTQDSGHFHFWKR